MRTCDSVSVDTNPRLPTAKGVARCRLGLLHLIELCRAVLCWNIFVIFCDINVFTEEGDSSLLLLYHFKKRFIVDQNGWFPAVYIVA